MSSSHSLRSMPAVWTCPELTWEPFMPDKPTEAQVTKMCGATAGTCYRNLTRPVDDRHASRWGVGGQSSGAPVAVTAAAAV